MGVISPPPSRSRSPRLGPTAACLSSTDSETTSGQPPLCAWPVETTGWQALVKLPLKAPQAVWLLRDPGEVRPLPLGSGGA